MRSLRISPPGSVSTTSTDRPKPSDRGLQRLARDFKVSTLVVLRRCSILATSRGRSTARRITRNWTAFWLYSKSVQAAEGTFTTGNRCG